MMQNSHDEQNPVLCIPESCEDYILKLYHISLLGAYQGCIRPFLTIKQKIVYSLFYALH